MPEENACLKRGYLCPPLQEPTDKHIYTQTGASWPELELQCHQLGGSGCRADTRGGGGPERGGKLWQQ
eukprot:scaffold162699_cov19-Tisochrysis_lutea.AAC.5